MTFSDVSGFKSQWTNIFSIQENFIDSIYSEYYIPNEINQELLNEAGANGKPIRMVNGKYDPGAMLYSNFSQDYTDRSYQKYRDMHDIVLFEPVHRYLRSYYKEIKMIVSEGFRDLMSLSTAEGARLCIGHF